MITTKATRYTLCSLLSLLFGSFSLLIPMNSAVAEEEVVLASTRTLKLSEQPPPWVVDDEAGMQANFAPSEPQPRLQPQPVVVKQPSAPATPSAARGGIAQWYQRRQQQAQGKQQNTQQVQAAAQRGDARSQYMLAMMYRGGAMGKVDMRQSLQWQQKAAQQGYAEAQYGLGLLYANGTHLPANPQLAKQWFERAAQQGHVQAKIALQAVPMRPLVRKPPVVAAKPAPRPRAQPPRPQAATAPRPVVVAKPPQAAALDYVNMSPADIRQHAYRGDKYAQLMLGVMYEEGNEGMPQDFKQALVWYQKAANQGFPKAQYNLALLYEDGRGMPQDYRKAGIWYQKAAAAGFAEAQNNLGVLHILGQGVQKDPKRAKALFQQAARQGNGNAQRNLEMLRNSG